MPHFWPARVRWLTHLRYLRVNLHSMDLLARDANAAIIHPILDGRFLAALGAAGGRVGFPDRTDAMAYLFSDLLPAPVLERPSKSTFNTVFWHRHSRSFAETWHGGGVDTDLVDPEILRGVWLSDTPDARSGTLLQAAWMASYDRED